MLTEGDKFGWQPANGRKVLVEFVWPTPPARCTWATAVRARWAMPCATCSRRKASRSPASSITTTPACRSAPWPGPPTRASRAYKPGDEHWPESAYNGDYIADIAADFLAKKTVKADDREFTASGDPEDIDGIRQFAVAYLRHEQDLDLKAFDVRFDNYYLESSLYTSGRVEQTVQKLVDAGKTYEQDGALWLRSTDYGDDKDRVMRKSEGGYTYFVPDVAYHIAKWSAASSRSSTSRAPTTTAPSPACAPACRPLASASPQGWPDYALHKMVTVMKNGEEVKISKRAGSYVTLRDLIEWTSKDAVRFFLISRKADTEFTFDVDLALKQNDENPVFYVQYAHARIQSVRTQYAEKGGDAERPGWRQPGPADRRYRAGADDPSGRIPRHAHGRRPGSRPARRRLLPA